MTLCGGESLPISSLTFDICWLQNPTYDLRLSLETQKGLPLNLASEDPAIDAGLEFTILFPTLNAGNGHYDIRYSLSIV